MREAGRVVARALDQVRRMAAPGVTTADLELIPLLWRTTGH